MKRDNRTKSRAFFAWILLCLFLCGGLSFNAFAKETDDDEHFTVEENAFFGGDESGSQSKQSTEPANSSRPVNSTENSQASQPTNFSQVTESTKETESGKASESTKQTKSTKSIDSSDDSRQQETISQNTIIEENLNFITPAQNKNETGVSANKVPKEASKKVSNIPPNTPQKVNGNEDKNRENVSQETTQPARDFFYPYVICGMGLLIWGTIRIIRRLRIVYGKL